MESQMSKTTVSQPRLLDVQLLIMKLLSLLLSACTEYVCTC